MRRSGRRSSAAAAVAVALIGLGACGGTTSKPRSTVSPPRPATSVRYDPDAAMTVGIGADPGQWNCDAAGTGQASCLAVVDQVWPSVFHEQADGSLALDQTFVTSAQQISDAPQTVVYHINPKATWSDGTPVTYRDFVYNWQAQSGSGNYRDVGGAGFTPASDLGYDDIAHVTGTAQDPDTVRVVFTHPDPDWRALFGAGDPLVPAQVAQRVGYDRGFTDPVGDVVSAGPFEVQRYTAGDQLTLVRNPRYWGTPADLAQVTFRFVADAAALAPALGNGELDAALATPLTPLARDVAGVRGVQVEQTASDTYEELDMNEANPFLADARLRHAIMLAVPRSTMLKRTVGGADSSIGLLGNRFSAPGAPTYHDNSGGAYTVGNATQAKAVLAQAGYVSGPTATLTRNGQPVALRITGSPSDPYLGAEEQVVVSALAPLGITVTVVDSSDLTTTLARGDFDLVLDTATAGPFPSQVEGAYSGGQADVDHINDPQVTALIDRADTTFDPSRRAALFDQIDGLLWMDDANLPLFQVPASLAVASTYLNVSASAAPEGPTYDLQQWGVKASS